MSQSNESSHQQSALQPIEFDPELNGGLTELHIDILERMSQGFNGGEISRQLGVTKREIHESKPLIEARFAVPTMPAAITEAFREGVLVAEITEDRVVTDALSKLDRALLLRCSQGVTSTELAKAMLARSRGYTQKDLDIQIQRVKRLEARAVGKIGGFTRAHAMRRMFELGLLTVPD